MATGAANLLEVFAKIPKDKIEAIYAVAKSAKGRVAKSANVAKDGEPTEDPTEATDETGLSENAQNALKAAGRILAPYAEELSPPVMGALGDAIGIEGADDTDVDGALEEATDAEGVSDVDMSKADGDEDPEDQDAQKSDDTEDDEPDAASKAETNLDGEDDDDAAAKADEGADDSVDGEEVLSKGDDDLADAMPDFSDASDADKEAALAAARTAFAAAMEDRGIADKAAKSKTAKADGDEDKDGTTPAPFATDEKKAKKSAAVAKSAVASLKGFNDRQRKDLEMVFKSHTDKLTELAEAHKTAVAKSARLERQLVRKSFVEEAAKSYAALGPAEEIGEAMMRLHDKDPEGVSVWKTVLKTANAQALAGGEHGLFAELGTMRGNSGGGAADAKIKAHVESVVLKSGATQSPEQIEAAFLATPAGKALYAESRREHELAQKGGR